VVLKYYRHQKTAENDMASLPLALTTVINASPQPVLNLKPLLSTESKQHLKIMTQQHRNFVLVDGRHETKTHAVVQKIS